MKVKLGQQIKFKAERKVSVANGGTVIVKKGDIARVTKKIDASTGEIVYLTGAAKGLCQHISIEVDDTIDNDAILKKILRELNE